MSSIARAAFDENAKDIERLLELHENQGGTTPGRRYGLEVLNKSAIVLLSAFWEAYCEDIAAEALAHIVEHAKDTSSLPNELKKIIAKEITSSKHELEVWALSGDGWRKYLTDRFTAMKTVRDRKLNTPKSQQIDMIFRDTIGIENISSNWKWKKMSAANAAKSLDNLVTLRGAIAHRGSHDAAVTKGQVEDYFEFIKKITAKTGGAVNQHVKAATGKPLWES